MQKEKIYRLSRKDKKRQEELFTLNKILSKCEKNEWKEIGLTTSSKNYRGIEQIAALLNEFAKKRKNVLEFEELKPVAFFADALEQAKKKDCIILVESYGETFYAELDKCSALLKEYNIPVMGVINYKKG
ncbi:hypothetical protein DWX08_12795 [Ruminococcus sp. AF18-22]|nr:hypothetical protein DWX08_12795 [Ruminococcus sp. AF18-22]